MSREDREAQRIHQEIERQISKSKKEVEKEVKLLLLGTLTSLRVLTLRFFVKCEFLGLISVLVHTDANPHSSSAVALKTYCVCHICIFKSINYALLTC